MQVTGSFPELSAGRSKARPAKRSASKKKKAPKESMAPFGQMAGKNVRRNSAPKSFGGRRAMAHALHGRGSAY